MLATMDPLTHSALGVACALVVTKPENRRAASLAGLAGGLLPDADIFLFSKGDPLFALEFHRHFTHSFAFSPVMMLLAAGIAGLILCLFRRPPRWKALLVPALIAVWSHIFCDLWTSYGTRAFWPFTDARSALDWVSVIDPVVTLPLLVLAIIALVRNSTRLAIWGLGWVALYLGMAVIQKSRAESALAALVAERGQIAVRATVKPSFGNILLWRAIYEENGIYHADAIRCGFGPVQICEGATVTRVVLPSRDAAWESLPAGSIQLGDLFRFAHFSDQWIAWHPTEPNVIGDLRYAQLPNEISPLWGIKFDRASPEKHVQMTTHRRTDSAAWKELWDMICGRGRWK